MRISVNNSQSFPYFSIANRLGVSYAKILSTLEFLEANPSALDYWASLHGPRADLHTQVALALQNEMMRRKNVNS